MDATNPLNYTIMNENEKKNEAVQKDPRLVAMEEALANFKEKLVDLLYNGNYSLNRINRDRNDHHVTWAEITVGRHRIVINEPPGAGKQGTFDLHFKMEECPISKDLLLMYNRVSVDNEISYHQRRLKELEEHKASLG